MILSVYNHQKKAFDYYESDQKNPTPAYGHRKPRGDMKQLKPESLALSLPHDAKYISSGKSPRGTIACCDTDLGTVTDASAYAAAGAFTVLNLALTGLTIYGGYSLYKKLSK